MSNCVQFDIDNTPIITNNCLELIDYQFADEPGVIIEYSKIVKLIVKQSIGNCVQNDQELLNFNQKLILFIKQFNNLLELEIVDYTQLTDENISELGEELLVNIQVLCFDGCETLTAITFQLVNTWCTSLVSFTFICPNCAKVFYKIDSKDIILFMRKHEVLCCLSLMVFKLEQDGFDSIIASKNMTNLILNVFSCDEFTSSSRFFEIVLRLLATSKYHDLCVYKNFDHLGCYDINSRRLVVCGAKCKKPVDLIKLLEEIFIQRRGTIVAVSLSDLKGVTNKVLSILANTNGDILRDVLISRCGKNVNLATIKYLEHRSKDLKFVLIICGAKALGMSGTCTPIGSCVLALLDDGCLFSKSYVEEEISCFLQSVDACFLLESFCEPH